MAAKWVEPAKGAIIEQMLESLRSNQIEKALELSKDLPETIGFKLRCYLAAQQLS
jgi:hypothetical protein